MLNKLLRLVGDFLSENRDGRLESSNRRFLEKSAIEKWTEDNPSFFELTGFTELTNYSYANTMEKRLHSSFAIHVARETLRWDANSRNKRNLAKFDGTNNITVIALLVLDDTKQKLEKFHEHVLNGTIPNYIELMERSGRDVSGCDHGDPTGARNRHQFFNSYSSGLGSRLPKNIARSLILIVDEYAKASTLNKLKNIQKQSRSKSENTKNEFVPEKEISQETQLEQFRSKLQGDFATANGSINVLEGKVLDGIEQLSIKREQTVELLSEFTDLRARAANLVSNKNAAIEVANQNISKKGKRQALLRVVHNGDFSRVKPLSLDGFSSVSALKMDADSYDFDSSLPLTPDDIKLMKEINLLRNKYTVLEEIHGDIGGHIKQYDDYASEIGRASTKLKKQLQHLNAV